MTPTRLSTIALAALLLTLAACGKKENNDNAAPAEQASEQSERKFTSNGLEIEEQGGILLPRQPLLPFERYTVLDQSKHFRTNNQAETTQVEQLYRNVFWAGAGRDDDLLAYDFLPEVRAENDAFKRADIVKARRAELDAAYAEAKKQKHYALYLDRDFLMSIGPYDAQKKGFLVDTGIRGDIAYGWPKPKEHEHNAHASWMIEFAGTGLPENLRWYIPKDEAEARKLEASLSKLRSNPASTVDLPGYYFGHIADLASRPEKHQYNALLVVDGIAVTDPATRQPLLTMDFHALQPKAIVREASIKQALQPEPKPAS